MSQPVVRTQRKKREERRKKLALKEVLVLYVCMEEMQRSVRLTRLTRLSFATATE
jgi:hypothetical protein